MKGILRYENEKWVVQTTQGILPLHPDIKLNKDITQRVIENGATMIDYVVTTIAIGENEFDVIDCDVAVIKTSENIDNKLNKLYGV